MGEKSEAASVQTSNHKEEEEYGEEDEEKLIGQPFYTFDEQTDEQYYIIDNDSYDHNHIHDSSEAAGPA